ncbi:hypothetical protein MYO4S_00138 [Serratia phage 4S]|nr:hypothetical protein MYO4S_00138 [Serratia phage 4S]
MGTSDLDELYELCELLESDHTLLFVVYPRDFIYLDVLDWNTEESLDGGIFRTPKAINWITQNYGPTE